MLREPDANTGKLPAKVRGDACACETGTMLQPVTSVPRLSKSFEPVEKPPSSKSNLQLAPLTSQKSIVAGSSVASASTLSAGFDMPRALGNISSRLSKSWSSSCTEALACASSNG